jgi:hypothetical protein
LGIGEIFRLECRHGGISTFNRELCTALAALGHKLVCAVIESSQDEKADAARAGITLVDAPKYPTVEGGNRLLTLSKDIFGGFLPDVVIGHDHITGAAGMHLAGSVFKVPYVHVVHTAPEAAERHKTRGAGGLLDGSKKAETQKQLCCAASLVVCVGPLLHRLMQTALQTYPISVVELRPGLNKGLLKKKVDVAKVLAPYCLFLGRLEDGRLKGADIACHIISTLNSKWEWPKFKRPTLIMRGFEELTIDRD